MSTALEKSHDPSEDSDLPPVPVRVLSRTGTVVETLTSAWRLTRDSRTYVINWDLLDQVGATPLLTERARHLLQLYLADRITKKASGTVSANYTRMLYFARWLATHANDQALGVKRE